MKILKSTYWTLSWGLALRFPLTEEEGSRRLCSHMELAPLPYSVWTIYNINTFTSFITLSLQSHGLFDCASSASSITITSISFACGGFVCTRLHVFTCNWEDGHEEWVRCRTWELCRPKPRWMLQHSSQINTPLLTEAQRGSGVGCKC